MIYLLAQEAPAADMSWPAALVVIFGLLASTGVLGALVKLLHAKAKKLEAALDGVVEGVEKIEDEEAKAKAKASIKRTSMARQVEPDLAELVKKKTGRIS